VREPSETPDDFPVLARPLEVGIALEEFQGEFLVLQRLAVLERQVGKHPLVRRHRLVPALIEDRACSVASQRVGGKRPRRIAKHVARELVEQHHKGEATAGRLLPGAQHCRGPEFVVRQKVLADFLVQGGILLEPGFAIEPEPELHNLIGMHGGNSARPAPPGACQRAGAQRR